MKSIFKFLPLLVLFTIVIILLAKTELRPDEIRYLNYANNLTHGYFTNPENPFLESGPGYPLLLTVFVALKSPIIIIKVFNGLWVFIGLLFFYKLLLTITSKKIATIMTYVLGLYYPFFIWMSLIYTESFSFLLLCLLLYSFSRISTHGRKWVIYSILVLGYLILTRYIFAYVSIALIVLLFIAYIFLKKKEILRYLIVCLIGFGFSIPYLFYTYSLTGKIFYWSTISGQGIYWLTTTYENEYGSWLNLDDDFPGINPAHKVLYDSIKSKSYVEQNDIIKSNAINNIKNNPKIYAYNVAVNSLRFFFQYPISYHHQRPWVYHILIPNMLMFFLLVFTLYPAWLNKRSIPIGIYVISGFFLIYASGSVLLVSHYRFLLPLIPFFIFWITYIGSNFIQLKFTRDLNTKTVKEFNAVDGKKSVQ